jgi:hypothetical protein
MTDDVRKLLGGYATGTLTEAEKQALFAAALEDAELFNVLADEEALRELLDDPAARAQVLQATETHVFSMAAVLREWFERPRAKVLVAVGAVLVVAITITTYRDQRRSGYAQIARTAQPSLTAPYPRQQDSPPPSPSSAPTEKRQALRSAPVQPAKPASPQQKPEAALADAAAGVKQKMEAAKEKLVRQEPQPVLVSAAPPGANAVVSTFFDQQPARSLAAGTAPVKYVLLKRSPTGEYQPVAASTEFAADEEPRLAVSATEAGTIRLSRDDSASITSTVVEPGRTATFTVPAAARSLVLSFSPATSRLTGSTLVPSVRPQLRTSEAEARTKQAADAPAQTPSGPLLIEIKLNRK